MITSSLFKKIFLLLVFLACGYSADLLSPVRNNAPTRLTIKQLEKVMIIQNHCYRQLQNIHRKFDPESVEKRNIEVCKIKKLFEELAEDVFLLSSKRQAGGDTPAKFTPYCRIKTESFLGAIGKLSPGTFVKQDYRIIEQTFEPEDLPVIFETNFGNRFYVPKWFLEPKYGFVLWREKTQTLSGAIEYGSYNAIRMLDGENPKSGSGTMELHHAFQNQGTIIYLPYWLHKKDHKVYHRSKSDTLVDRSICANEFPYVNKAIAFFAILKLCQKSLERKPDNVDLSEETLRVIKWTSEYRGNVDEISEWFGYKPTSSNLFTSSEDDKETTKEPLSEEDSTRLIFDEKITDNSHSKSKSQGSTDSDSHSSEGIQLITRKSNRTRSLSQTTSSFSSQESEPEEDQTTKSPPRVKRARKIM